MKESDGEFTGQGYREAPHTCGGKVRVETWESSCGGYVDHKYTCESCGDIWWIDGIDS